MKKHLMIAVLLFLAPLALFADTEMADDGPGLPRIVYLERQRVLVVDAQGDPERVAGPAFKSLFQAFYANADKSEKRHAGVPRARWNAARMDSLSQGPAPANDGWAFTNHAR